jgi:hypothetical protein
MRFIKNDLPITLSNHDFPVIIFKLFCLKNIDFGTILIWCDVVMMKILKFNVLIKMQIKIWVIRLFFNILKSNFFIWKFDLIWNTQKSNKFIKRVRSSHLWDIMIFNVLVYEYLIWLHLRFQFSYLYRSNTSGVNELLRFSYRFSSQYFISNRAINKY